MEVYTLQNGKQIPKVGFGTWQLEPGEETRNSVKEALALGYRHIDTAQIYGNEQNVGEAVSESGIAREDLFITTKVWNDKATYEDTLASVEESLEKLQTSYVDLLLIHWPNPFEHRENPGYEKRNAEVWRAFETLYQEGKAKAIGVSNFLPHHFEALMKTAEIKPMVNQISLAPGAWQDQEKNVAFFQGQDLLLEAYSPLGSGKIFKNETMDAIADKKGKSVAQIALAWSLSHGFLPLPRSHNPKNIKSNLDFFDIDLSQEEIDAINGIEPYYPLTDPDKSNF